MKLDEALRSASVGDSGVKSSKKEQNKAILEQISASLKRKNPIQTLENLFKKI